MEIIPTLLVKTEEEFMDRLRKVEDFVDTVQIDVIDGKFAPNTTWADIEIIKDIETKVNFEVDLMVKNVDEIAMNWLDLKSVKRIIPHIEAVKNVEVLIDQIKNAKKEVGMAIGLGTSVEKLEPFLEKLDSVMVMGVKVGFGGQKFDERALEKIEELKKMRSDLRIGVDGGVNLETTPRMIEAGASMLSIGSAIFESDNIAETIEKFKTLK